MMVVVIMQSLEDFIRSNIDQFTTKKGPGVILFTYSLILSRGVEQLRADMDENFAERRMLIDRHGYAAQELVNLCLIGRAHSNVFDRDKVIEDSTGSKDCHLRMDKGKARVS